jgi:signal peptidase II
MIVKNLGKNFIFNLSLVLLIFLLDRISKIYVIYLDKKILGSEIFSSKFLNITLIWNEGIAFGLLSFDQANLYNILTILILFVILIISFMITKNVGIKKYSLILILGGALGNVYDRIFYKAVPDFIDMHIGNFHWFIFNVSDIFITVGVIFMILLEIVGNNKKELNEKN